MPKSCFKLSFGSSGICIWKKALAISSCPIVSGCSRQDWQNNIPHLEDPSARSQAKLHTLWPDLLLWQQEEWALQLCWSLLMGCHSRLHRQYRNYCCYVLACSWMTISKRWTSIAPLRSLLVKIGQLLVNLRLRVHANFEVAESKSLMWKKEATLKDLCGPGQYSGAIDTSRDYLPWKWVAPRTFGHWSPRFRRWLKTPAANPAPSDTGSVWTFKVPCVKAYHANQFPFRIRRWSASFCWSPGWEPLISAEDRS